MITDLFTPNTIWFCLALGACAGFLGGLLGIGGGFILVPGLYFAFQTHFKISPSAALLYATGTTMACIGLISLSATHMNHRRKTVLWDVFRRMALFLFLGAVLGAFIATKIDTHYIKLAFAAFCIYAGLRMVFSYTTEPSPNATLNTTNTAPYGFGFGLFSGMIGVGGANLVIPFLVKRQAKMRDAFSTSSSLQLPIAFGATLAYVLFGAMSHPKSGADPFTGFVAFPVVGLVGLASLVSTPVGVWVSHTLPIPLLKRIFGLFTVVIGVHMSGFVDTSWVWSSKKANKPVVTAPAPKQTAEPEPTLTPPKDSPLQKQDKAVKEKLPDTSGSKTQKITPRDIR